MFIVRSLNFLRFIFKNIWKLNILKINLLDYAIQNIFLLFTEQKFEKYAMIQKDPQKINNCFLKLFYWKKV